MVDPGALWLGTAVVLVLLAASAFFSATELAIFSLPATGPSAVEDPRARALRRLRDDPHRLLVTLLVGNNLVNVGLTSVVTLWVATLLPPGEAIVATTLLASTVVLVFGEILPKAYGLGHAEGWALSAARPLLLVGLVLAPIVVAFDLLTGRVSRWIGGERGIEQPYVD